MGIIYRHVDQMSWFEKLTGVPETTPEEVRSQLRVSGETLSSLANARTWHCGKLDVLSLQELRRQAELIPGSSTLTVKEVVANVQDLHANPSNAGALFQVASQFNLLEMVSPHVTPEQGIGIYENDFTQGPACAIAAGAGTIYRNYFAPVRGRMGQTADNQIDCLEAIGVALGNYDDRLWQMQNGYALAKAEGLEEITQLLKNQSHEERDELRSRLKVGFQRDTGVTIGSCSHKVGQLYASALPVAYSAHSADEWEAFAVLILEAAYEATLCAAKINAADTGNPTVFLTLLGGGAFGNRTEWIIQAIRHALKLHSLSGLDVRIVSYGSPNPDLQELPGMAN